MNENQSTPVFVKKNAAYFRARARDTLRGKWGTAILIGFLAILLSATVMGGFDPNINIDLSDLNDFNDVNAETLAPITDEVSMDTIWNVILIGLLAGSVTTVAYAIFVSSPLKLGYQRINLDLVDGEMPEVKRLFSYFSINYLRSVRLNIVYWLATSLIVVLPIIVMLALSLGLIQEAAIMLIDAENVVSTLLELLEKYVLPLGIATLIVLATSIVSMVLSYTYRFAYMIMAEYPHMGAIEAMRVSRNMMKGNKWRLFCLDISFIGWVILSAIVTFGLGVFVLLPYREAAMAAFYDDLAHRNAAKETEFPSLNFDDYAVDEERTDETPVQDPEPTDADDEEESSPTNATNGFMPFTTELEFPSLDLDDYADDGDADKKE